MYDYIHTTSDHRLRRVTKEPYIHAKEPYTHAQEPYIL